MWNIYLNKKHETSQDAYYYSFKTCVRRSAGLYLSELYSRDVDNLSIKIIIDNFQSDI